MSPWSRTQTPRRTAVVSSFPQNAYGGILENAFAGNFNSSRLERVKDGESERTIDDILRDVAEQQKR